MCVREGSKSILRHANLSHTQGHVDAMNFHALLRVLRVLLNTHAHTPYIKKKEEEEKKDIKEAKQQQQRVKRFNLISCADPLWLFEVRLDLLLLTFP